MSSQQEIAREKPCPTVINLLLIAEAREDGDMDGWLAVGEAFSAAMARNDVQTHANTCATCQANGWFVKK
jgi:hypothetical protein